MADEVISTQTAEGGGEGTPSQGQAPSEQSDGQGQGAGTEQIKVESVNQQNTQADARPQASRFFHNREVNRLKRELDEIKQTLSQRAYTAPAQSSPAEITIDKFWENPMSVIDMKMKQLEERLPQFLTGHFESYQKQMKQREDSDYVEKLLAPDGELRQKDPQVVDRLEQIILDNPQIDEFSKVNFRAALEMALALDKTMNRRPERTPFAPKKSSAQSTVSGTANGSSQSSFQGLKEKADKLRSEIENDPALKYNAEHKKKRQAVLDELTKLAEDANKG